MGNTNFLKIWIFQHRGREEWLIFSWKKLYGNSAQVKIIYSVLCCLNNFTTASYWTAKVLRHLHISAQWHSPTTNDDEGVIQSIKAWKNAMIESKTISLQTHQSHKISRFNIYFVIHIWLQRQTWDWTVSKSTWITWLFRISRRTRWRASITKYFWTHWNVND